MKLVLSVLLASPPESLNLYDASAREKGWFVEYIK